MCDAAPRRLVQKHSQARHESSRRRTALAYFVATNPKIKLVTSFQLALTGCPRQNSATSHGTHNPKMARPEKTNKATATNRGCEAEYPVDLRQFKIAKEQVVEMIDRAIFRIGTKARPTKKK